MHAGLQLCVTRRRLGRTWQRCKVQCRLWQAVRGGRLRRWSFGILMYELVYGFTPFRGAKRDQTFENILKRPLVFPPKPEISKPCQVCGQVVGLPVPRPPCRGCSQCIERPPGGRLMPGAELSMNPARTKPRLGSVQPLAAVACCRLRPGCLGERFPGGCQALAVTDFGASCRTSSRRCWCGSRKRGWAALRVQRRSRATRSLPTSTGPSSATPSRPMSRPPLLVGRCSETPTSTTFRAYYITSRPLRRPAAASSAAGPAGHLVGGALSRPLCRWSAEKAPIIQTRAAQHISFAPCSTRPKNYVAAWPSDTCDSSSVALGR